MRTFLVVLMLGLGNQTFAQTSPNDILDTFFNLMAEDKAEAAIDYSFNTNPFNKGAFADPGLQMKRQFNTQIQTFGDYLGYEVIVRRQTGDSYIRMGIMLRYEASPIRLNMVLYKPSETWQVQEMNLSGKIEEPLIPER